MNSNAIRQEISIFEGNVRKLSSEIGKVATIWQDEHYSQLFSSIQSIANMSKEVIVAGDRCCSSIDAFSRVADEEY